MNLEHAKPVRMIPQIEPWIDSAEELEMRRVVASTFVVEHDLTREFEARTRELTGARHAIAMCNGTAALYVCLKAIGIGPGDEVIVPDLTFVATANAVILAGATPVLCDIDPTTLCIDTNRAEALVGARTRAIMPVHLYGQSADMVLVSAFAQRHGLHVVEDAAQGVGVEFEGKHVGTFGAMGVLSYYGNKTITCGEGGMVLTDDDELARIAYRLKNHGRDVKGTFVHEHIGFNFSFTEMQAAIGISQMKKLPAIVRRKQDIHDRYVSELGELSRTLTPVNVDGRCRPVFWFTSFLSDDAEPLSEWLRDRGVQTRRFFYPLHLQPCYSQNSQLVRNLDGVFAITDASYRRGISVPSSYSLSAEDQSLVMEHIRQFYENRR